MAKAESDPGFQLYDVKVRLSGSRDNEARRFGVTAPEAMLLGMIHGDESLCEVVKLEGRFAKDDEGSPRSEAQERMRLVEIFEGRNPSPGKRGFVGRIFGNPVTGNRLPKTIPGDFRVAGAVSVQKLPDGDDSVAMALS